MELLWSSGERSEAAGPRFGGFEDDSNSTANCAERGEYLVEWSGRGRT